MQSNFYSRSRRLNHLYKITSKSGTSITFKRNKAQEIVAQRKKEIMEKKGRVLLLILKGRQLGITTYACIENYDAVHTRSNISAVIVAHNQEKQKDIFKKVEYAHKHLHPEINLKDGKVFEKKKTRLQNVTEIFLENNSGIKVSLDSRSGTYQRIHISELAFRDDAKAMMTGTIPSLPMGGELVVETTANGVGNYFHHIRQENWNNPNGAFSCLFLGWWLAEEYHLPVGKEEEIILPKELQHLRSPMIDGTVLTPGQIKRYLEQYRTLGEEAFQEYPSTPEEAFLHSGRPVFTADQINNIEVPSYTEDAEIPDLYIYREAPQKQIILGGDTSEGVPGGDNSAIIVRDPETLELYACYYGSCDPIYLCKVVDRLYRLGYWGRYGVEKNNTGHAFYAEAEYYERYDLLFIQQTVDRKTNIPTKKIGWETTAKTRPIMMTDLKKYIRDGYITEMDPRIKKEMKTFVYNESMKEEALKSTAESRHYDDGLLTEAITLQMLKYPMPEF